MGSMFGGWGVLGYVHYHNICWPPLIANIGGIPIQLLRDYPPNKTQCLNGLTEKLIASEMRIYLANTHFIPQEHISKFHMTLMEKCNTQFLPGFEEIT